VHYCKDRWRWVKNMGREKFCLFNNILLGIGRIAKPHFIIMFVALNSFAYNTFLDQNPLGILALFGSKEFHRIFTKIHSFGKFSQNAVWNKGNKNSDIEETFLQLLI
jgi:hypothetical protein